MTQCIYLWVSPKGSSKSTSIVEVDCQYRNKYSYHFFWQKQVFKNVCWRCELHLWDSCSHLVLFFICLLFQPAWPECVESTGLFLPMSIDASVVVTYVLCIGMLSKRVLVFVVWKFYCLLTLAINIFHFLLHWILQKRFLWNHYIMKSTNFCQWNQDFLRDRRNNG